MRITTIAFLVFFTLVSSTFAQEKSRKKFKSKAVKLNKDSSNSYLSEFQLDFPYLYQTNYYHDEYELSSIHDLERKKDYVKLLPELEEYVRNFGIHNFQKDNHLLWKLAQLYELNGHSEKSKSIYRLVLKHHHGKGAKHIYQHYDTLTAKETEKYVPLQYYYELVEYRKAIDTLKPPRSVFLNMGEMVNDPKYPDYGPTMNVKGNMLIFTKRKKEMSDTKLFYRENEELYYSINYDGFWDEAQPFSRVINSGCNEGSACLSRDGKTLYFARCKVLDHQFDCMDCLGSCDIYVSHMQADSTWGVAENLGPDVNTNSWDSQPTLSHSEDTLFFASDRLGGFGMADIYFTHKVNGRWSKAQNIGPVINTRGNEVSPFYHPKHDVLYFSSNGHLLNFGKLDTTAFIYRTFDIYKSQVKYNRYQEPKNIGPLVNSKGDEYYFTIDDLSKDLFYAKTEEPGSKNLDLFSFPLPMEAQPTANTRLSGTLKDSITGAPFKGIVSIIDLTNGIEVAPKYIRDDGSYEFDLIKDNDYLLVLQGDDFFRIDEKLHLTGDTNITMSTPAIKYNKWRFDRLEFDGNSADIRPEMEHDLDKIVDFMVSHPTFKLNISGHTDSDGNGDLNIKLSQKRADSIKKYILEKGNIESARITAIGFGNQKPIVLHESTEQDKHINRRVEFELIDGDK
jgi:hypothetical protein